MKGELVIWGDPPSQMSMTLAVYNASYEVESGLDVDEAFGGPRALVQDRHREGRGTFYVATEAEARGYVEIMRASRPVRVTLPLWGDAVVLFEAVDAAPPPGRSRAFASTAPGPNTNPGRFYQDATVLDYLGAVEPPECPTCQHRPARWLVRVRIFEPEIRV